jgi:hypothetical protein
MPKSKRNELLKKIQFGECIPILPEKIYIGE